MLVKLFRKARGPDAAAVTERPTDRGNHSSRPGRRAARRRSPARDYAEAVLVAVVVAFALRAFVAQAFKIPSGSMKPTLLVGDYIVVDKLSYRFRPPLRGDVIVFKYPRQDNDITLAKWFREFYELVVHRRRVPRHDYVKRVVGAPGDVVLAAGGTVFVNGEPLEESYLRGAASDDFGPFKVPAASYFVLGDSRASRRDSRYWGFVPRRLVRGRVILVYWSWIPAYCPRHRSRIERLYQVRLAGTTAREKPAPVRYVCDAGGETLVDGEDVRLAKWYELWRHVRWRRVMSAVK